MIGGGATSKKKKKKKKASKQGENKEKICHEIKAVKTTLLTSKKNARRHRVAVK
jgi:hypothetical protein